MTRRYVLLALAGGFTSLVAGALGSRFVRAAEPAQKVVRVGYVGLTSPSTASAVIASAFWDRLRELGYVEGQNLAIEERWAEGRYERLPAIMVDLIGRKVDVLVTTATRAAVAAKAATGTIPIVAVGLGDPVASGLVASLARPGGNLTGLSLGWGEGMAGKWLELLQEMVPGLSMIAVITNPDNPVARGQVKELQAISIARGPRIRLVELREPGALDRAFAKAKQNAQAVLVLPDPIIAAMSMGGQFTTLAARHRLPTIYAFREFVDAGGLMAYGPDLRVQYRRAAEYVDKILKGANPGDLPIEQPTQYVLVINLKTAKALGLTIPQSILLQADEVIR